MNFSNQLQINDLLLKINNLIQIGTISEIKPDKALARVNILGRVTNFMPVISFANEFKKHFTPIKVKEQVLVICPSGNPDIGFILRGIFNVESSEPQDLDSGTINENIEVIEYSDGTKFQYNTETKELKGNIEGTLDLKIKDKLEIQVLEDAVNINPKLDLNITADANLNINASGNIKVEAPQIDIN